MPHRQTPPAEPTQAEPPALKLRMRVTVDGHIAIGPGKIALLEALERHGSINAAAKALGMSYRRAWMLIDELNASLRSPAVVSATGGAHGGGSTLTEAGRDIVALYRGIEDETRKHSREAIARLLAHVAD